MINHMTIIRLITLAVIQDRLQDLKLPALVAKHGVWVAKGSV